MVTDLDELFDTEDLSSIMAQETNEVDEPPLSAPISDSTDSAGEPKVQSAVLLEEENTYDPQPNATSLVHGLQSLEQIVLNPIAFVKVRKDVGGKEVIDKMRKALTKEYSGKTLDDDDKRLLAGFESYKKNLEMLSDSLITSKKETEKMIEVAYGFCEETQFKAGKGMALAAAFTGSFVEKITRILFL